MSAKDIIVLILEFVLVVPSFVGFFVFLFWKANKSFKLAEKKNICLDRILTYLTLIESYSDKCRKILEKHDEEDINFTPKGGE